MRFFDILNTQHLILGVFFGLIAALLVYIGFGGPFIRPGKRKAGMNRRRLSVTRKASAQKAARCRRWCSFSLSGSQSGLSAT